jgi:hypothetical protein
MDGADLRQVVVSGALSLALARARVTEAIRSTRTSGARKLLVDMRDWQAPDVPSLSFRMDAVREWAAAAPPGLAFAVVLPAAMIDRERVGVVLGHRLGVNSEVFDSLDDAHAWLVRQKAFGPMSALLSDQSSATTSAGI